MRQVVQSLRGGPVRVIETAAPSITSTQVLVATSTSLMSPGTERAVTALAQQSLIAKARARPDLVSQVIGKARVAGIRETTASVRGRLDEDSPLGYSGAGIAIEVGSAVDGIHPGQLVATGSAGHAEFQTVPGLLCAPVPDGVTPDRAAFATLGAIALHGFRLAEAGPGSVVAVVGLGLVGQLTARIARAAGCEVLGLDLEELPILTARSAGVTAVSPSAGPLSHVAEMSRGLGADAVIVTAADRTSKIMQAAPELARDRGVIVVVGDVGMSLSRRDLYDKELTVKVARSYGPGRYETSYEDWAVDYPVGSERWTEGRNQLAVLDLIASNRLTVDDLITHRYPIERAPDAYELIASRSEPHLGILFEYEHTDVSSSRRTVVNLPQRKSRASRRSLLGVGMIGAGSFATSTLLPSLARTGALEFVSIASASGLSARRVGEQFGFMHVVPDLDAMLEDKRVEVVIIATDHRAHAVLATQALDAGRNVWCEKPLALEAEELQAVENAWENGVGSLFVGFNRRYSTAVQEAAEFVGAAREPLSISYRVSAGPIPPNHWYADRMQGGRLLGEVCHFVDTCEALAGPIDDVVAFSSGAKQGRLADNFALAIRHSTGGLSTITYSSAGWSKTAKERIEIMGGRHTVVIDDFKGIALDGTSRRRSKRDKGHQAAADAFAKILRAGEPTAVGVSASHAVLRAAASLARRADDGGGGGSDPS